MPLWASVATAIDRDVEFGGGANDAGLLERPGVRQQRVGELVVALVGEGVRGGGAAQQRQPHQVAVDVVAVLAVVHQRHAVAVLGEVGEAVGRDLEAGDVPTGVGVRRPGEVAPLDLVVRLGRADIDREGGLEHRVVIVPVDLRVEVDPRAVGVDDHLLRDRRLRALADERHLPVHLDRDVHGVLLDDLEALQLRAGQRVLGVVLRDVPGVPVGGAVLVDLPARWRRRPWRRTWRLAWRSNSSAMRPCLSSLICQKRLLIFRPSSLTDRSLLWQPAAALAGRIDHRPAAGRDGDVVDATCHRAGGSGRCGPSSAC